MSFPNIRNRKIRRELGHRWGKLSAAAWKPQDPDYDTLRKRALYDRRGVVLRQGVTFHGDGHVTNWHVRHAVNGRTDQFELIANDRVYRRAGKRGIPLAFRPDSHD
jgi:hypothetical protein